MTKLIIEKNYKHGITIIYIVEYLLKQFIYVQELHKSLE